MNDDKALPILVFGIIFISFASVGIYNFVYRHEISTKEIVENIVKVKLDSVENDSFLSEKDSWGNNLKFQRKASPLTITQTITSSGADFKFNTGDDIQASHTDINKSKLLGHYVGSRTKEFIRGLKESEKEPSRFDKFTR